MFCRFGASAVDFLAARLGLGPGRTVVDLAAGTGKLTRPLLALAVGARVLDGTAESLPLPSASADAVAVAQAFHWFDGDVALAEIIVCCVRLRARPGLEPPADGRAAEPGDRGAGRPYRGRTSTFQTGAWRAAFERTKLFGPFEERVFANEQSLDADRLVDRIASISFIAALDEKERTKVLRAVRALAGPAGVTIHHNTEVQVADRLPARRALRRHCP